MDTIRILEAFVHFYSCTPLDLRGREPESCMRWKSTVISSLDGYYPVSRGLYAFSKLHPDLDIDGRERESYGECVCTVISWLLSFFSNLLCIYIAFCTRRKSESHLHNAETILSY